MNRQQFASYLKSVEAFADKNPKAHERRVKLLILVGYSFFVGVFAAVWIVPLLFVVGAISDPKTAWMMLKSAVPIYYLISLLVYIAVLQEVFEAFLKRQPAPDGIEVAGRDAIRLSAMIEGLCERLESPRPDAVKIVAEFNAAVVSMPRFGVLGQRNYLLIGLPLFLALSTRQFEAVIAHELGHISERHGRLQSRAYQVRGMWMRLAERQYAENKKPGYLFSKFLNWYFPILNAYTIVLCRRHEKSADASAVELSGPTTFGEALVAIAVKSGVVDDRFRHGIVPGAAASETPPEDVYTRLLGDLRATDEAEERRHLAGAVAVAGDPLGVHASLAERLRAIGYWTDGDLPRLPRDNGEPAASELLGGFANTVVARLNAEWVERVRDDWRRQYEYLALLRARFAELDGRDVESLNDAELAERASLIGQLNDDRAALAAWRLLLERDPASVEATYNIGSIMLALGDDEGVAWLEKAAAADPRLRHRVFVEIHDYQRLKGRDEEAESYLLAIDDEERVIDAANRERSKLLPTDVFDVHKLTPAQYSAIRERIGEFEEVETAYVVRKVVENYDDELPANVLFIEVAKSPMFGGGARLKGKDLATAVLARLEDVGIGHVAILERNFKRLRPRLERIDDAVVYRAAPR